MSGRSDATLLAIALPRPAAAEAVIEAWASGRAVTVLDPDGPPAVTRAALDAARPTHIVDGTGERRLSNGIPVTGEIAAVVMTSGTAAAPRAVELTWRGLDASARAVSVALAVDHDRDCWLLTLPLTAAGGLAIVARSWTTKTPLTVDSAFSIASIASAPSTRGATIVSLVATQLTRLLDANAPLHEYRAVLLGGGPVPDALRDRARDAGVALRATYGMTETWGGCVHDGHALDGVTLRLAATTQEIEVTGDCVMRRYRDDSTATAAAFTTDGWYRTGDLGRWSAPATLAVVDRIGDLIISGGVNVSPTAVEAVLRTHPQIADVAVTGRDDVEWGQRVVAYVVPRDSNAPPSLESVRADARDRLRPAELPRELVLVDSIPRTAGGKPRRAALRDSPRA